MNRCPIGLESPPLGVDVTFDGQWSYAVLSSGNALALIDLKSALLAD
jgi:hypothetical protein